MLGATAASWAVVCLAAWAAAAQPRAIRTRHFSVYYERLTEKPSAGDAARIGEARLPEIAADLGYAPSRPIVIAVYRDRRDFLEQADVSGPGAIGIVRYPENIIYLDVSGSRLRLEDTVPHEMVHVIVLRLLGARHIEKLPRWFNEGLAEYESQVWTPMQDAALAHVIRERRAVALADLNQAFGREDETVGEAYLQAWSVVRFLVDREGEGFIRRILAVLKTHPDFESALASETGLDLTALDRAWRRATQGIGPKPPRALMWGLLAVYALGAVAAVGTAVKIWLRLRRRARALEDEHPGESEETRE